MPRKYPEEFRRDVIAETRRGDVTLRQVAEDFGVSSTCVQRWVAQAEIEDGSRPGARRLSRPRCVSCGAVTVCSSRRTRYCVVRPLICPGFPPK